MPRHFSHNYCLHFRHWMLVVHTAWLKNQWQVWRAYGAVSALALFLHVVAKPIWSIDSTSQTPAPWQHQQKYLQVEADWLLTPSPKTPRDLPVQLHVQPGYHFTGKLRYTMTLSGLLWCFCRSIPVILRVYVSTEIKPISTAKQNERRVSFSNMQLKTANRNVRSDIITSLQ